MSTLATLVVSLVGDIGKFTADMKQAEGQAKSAGGGISSALNGALGTVGNIAKAAGAAVVAGIGAATGAAIAGVTAYNHWADTLDSLGDVLGTTADESAGLAVAIRIVGGDVDGITGQMAKLVKGLGDADGKAGPTAKALKALGVSAWDANGNLKGSTSILTAVADQLAKMPDGLEKTKIMTDLFGKSGKDLSDTMNALANGGLAAAEEKARALGLAIGEDGVNKSIEFGKSFETIKLAAEGLAVSVGGVLMPIIVPAIQKFTEWAVSVMPQVRAGIEGVFTWIQANVGPIIAAMVAWLQSAVAWVQTNWPIISAEISGAFEKARAVVEPIINAISNFIQSVFGAIGTFLQTHGAEIQAFVSTAWAGIQQIVNTVTAIVSGVVSNVFNAIAGFIREHGAQIQIILDTAWKQVKTVVETAINVVKGVVNTVMAVLKGDWSTAWNTIKSTVDTIWNGIKALWQNFWDGVDSILHTMGTSIQGVWDSFWGGVRATVDRIWNGILGFLEGAVNGAIDIVNGMIQGFNDTLGQIMGPIALIPHVTLGMAGDYAAAGYALGAAFSSGMAGGLQPALAGATANMAAIGSGQGGDRFVFGDIIINEAQAMSAADVAQAVMDEAARRADSRMRLR